MAIVALEHIRKKALSLSDTDRAQLAHELLLSLDGPPDDDAPTAWDAELNRRMEEIESGKVMLVDADEFARRVRSRLLSSQ